MYLTDFDIRIKDNNKSRQHYLFSIEASTVENLYKNTVGKYKTERWWKALVLLHTEIKDKSELPPERFEKPIVEKVKNLIKTGQYYYKNMVEDGWEVATIHRYFDFNNYFKQNNNTKKRLILNELHESTKTIARHFGWDTEPFDKAYQKCLEVDIQNNWISKKLKTKSSPNRKYKAAVYFEYDIYEIRVYAIIFDKNGKQISKTKLFTLNGLDKNVMYPDDIMSVITGKTKWIKNEFILYDKSGKEIGRTNVEKAAVLYREKTNLHL